MATDLETAHIVRKNLKQWRREEIEKLIWMGLSGQHSDTDLCEVNNLTLDAYYYWRELYIKGGRDSLIERTSDKGLDLRARVEMNKPIPPSFIKIYRTSHFIKICL